MTPAQANMNAIVDEIDKQIRTRLWFDFEVAAYDGYKLVIAGSTDQSYYHEMEIIFEHVFFVQGFFNGWHSDTSKAVFIQPEEVDTFIREFEIEAGHSVFIFKTEDYDKDIIIIAEKVSYNTDTVFYYERADLKEGQRIADFVKRGTPKDLKD